jgi:hypothetical protein
MCEPLLNSVPPIELHSEALEAERPGTLEERGVGVLKSVPGLALTTTGTEWRAAALRFVPDRTVSGPRAPERKLF